MNAHNNDTQEASTDSAAAETLKSGDAPKNGDQPLLKALWQARNTALGISANDFGELQVAIIESMETSGVKRGRLAHMLDTEVREGRAAEPRPDDVAEYGLLHDAFRTLIGRQVG